MKLLPAVVVVALTWGCVQPAVVPADDATLAPNAAAMAPTLVAPASEPRVDTLDEPCAQLRRESPLNNAPNFPKRIESVAPTSIRGGDDVTVVLDVGLTPGARTFARLARQGDAPFPTLAEGRAAADGTDTLRFAAPREPLLVAPLQQGRVFPCVILHAGDEGGGVTEWVPYTP